MKPDAAGTPWRRAALAAALFAVDPGLGLWLRGGHGPARDALLSRLNGWFDGKPWRKCPLGVGDDRLLGGLDIAATLQAGKAVVQTGLLAEAHGGALLLPMAERVPPSAAAKIAAAMDIGTVVLARDGFEREWPARFGLIALDEGVEDEIPPPALTDRLGLVVDLAASGHRDVEPSAFDAQAIARARTLTVEAQDAAAATLTTVAARIGADSLRAPLFALRAARALAALEGRQLVDDDDLALAAALTLAPRATQSPAPQDAPPPEEPPAQEPPPENPDAQDNPENQPSVGELEEMVLQAVRAALPADLLVRLLAVDHARRKAGSVGKSGATSLSKLRGRPMEARPGNPREGRLALVATLRAAAPWQRLRARADGRLSIQADDLRITRFKQKRGTTTIFIVDASGSQAARRLAEVKGAIERLLADCYVRRDSVALVAFRGKTAEIILPPTRSIARARRTLAGLPGGGGTPLASGLFLGLEVAERIQRKGETALIVLMTDGRANIARDGSPGREKAGAEALEAAKLVRLAGLRALTIDSSAPSRRGEAKPLAQAMQALYLPLPFADSGAIDRAVRAAARG